MAIVDSGLATRGVGSLARFRILKRHFYSFLRHLTFRKLNNFLRTELNRIKKRDILDSYPYILKIEPSNICNLRCAYCYDNRRQPHDGERKYGRMSADQFRAIVDEIGEYVFKINLYGFGEPWLFPETLAMIRYATDNNIGVGVSSNMNFSDPALPKAIVNSGLEVLIFSIHGVTQETYSKFMQGGNMEIAFANLSKVIEERRKQGFSKPFIDWQFCVTGFNEHEIPLAEKMAEEMGVDQIRFIKPIFPDDASDEWFSSMFPKNTFRPQDSIPPPDCSWPYRSAYINWDGGILPCCREFRLLANDFGNIFKDGFKAVWNNQRYRSSRRLLASPSEKQCDTICRQCPVTNHGKYRQ